MLSIKRDDMLSKSLKERRHVVEVIERVQKQQLEDKDRKIIERKFKQVIQGTLLEEIFPLWNWDCMKRQFVTSYWIRHHSRTKSLSITMHRNTMHRNIEHYVYILAVYLKQLWKCLRGN